MTIGKLTQDLQKAGFTDAKVIEDAFLIQTITKDGNPVMMTLGPDGITALEMSNSSGGSQAGTTEQTAADSKSCRRADEARKALDKAWHSSSSFRPPE